MKDTPILMCAEMVRATLRDVDPKGQTRRVIKPQPIAFNGRAGGEWIGWPLDDKGGLLKCPYGKVGDRLWVKETHYLSGMVVKYGMGRVRYRADDMIRTADGEFSPAVANPPKWRPSIFMPRWASRIDLDLVAVRTERVQEISVEDALAEGLTTLTKDNGRTWKYGIPAQDGLPATTEEAKHGAWEWHRWRQSPIDAYQVLWNSINLAPSPRYGVHPQTGKKFIDHYEAFPWSDEDFEAAYPGASTSGFYRGRPITVRSNPRVWVLGFRRGVTGSADAESDPGGTPASTGGTPVLPGSRGTNRRTG